MVSVSVNLSLVGVRDCACLLDYSSVRLIDSLPLLSFVLSFSICFLEKSFLLLPPTLSSLANIFKAI